MELQLHDSSLDAPSWFRRAKNLAVNYYPNPYYQAAKFAYRHRPGFLRDEMLSGWQDRLPWWQKVSWNNMTSDQWKRLNLNQKKLWFKRNQKQGIIKDFMLAEKVLHEMQGTPSYQQFLSESGLSGNEPFDLQASRFGTWLKTKAVPGLQKIQQKLSPIIGMLPGGGAVNAAFDIIKRPDGAPGPAVEPVISPVGPAMPQLAPAIAPTYMPQPEPQYPMAPDYAGFAPQPAPSGLPFGLDLKTLLLLGVGGIVAYKALKK